MIPRHLRALGPVALAAVLAWPAAAQEEPRLSDEPIPVREDIPRPKLLLELGEPFLGQGETQGGIRLPTGAVWQPALWVFGTYRIAAQSFDDGDVRRSEVTNRLDLFANLKLSGTERILLGIRPLDDDGRFTEYRFQPDRDDGFVDATNLEIETLFFEGEFAEIFPDLDPEDTLPLDVGFSVGRQPLLFQDGMLIDDTIDAVGLTRNTLLPGGASNLRVTALYGWGNVHRDDNRRDGSVHLFGLFTALDVFHSLIEADLAYVLDAGNGASGDAIFAGISATQPLGPLDTTFRVVSSFPLERETSAAGRGTLLFAELAWTPPGREDVLYLDGFWGIDEFSSAARGPTSGGPLGRTGILFAAQGLGRYGSPLSNRARDVFGGALGYQLFLDQTRKQLIFELGGVLDTDGRDAGQAAFGVRYQQKIGAHTIFVFDTFLGVDEGDDDLSSGARIELLVKF